MKRWSVSLLFLACASCAPAAAPAPTVQCVCPAAPSQPLTKQQRHTTVKALGAAKQQIDELHQKLDTEP